MVQNIGEIAALLTSFAWSITSTTFTLAGRRIGSVVLNRVRLLMALILLVITHWIIIGKPIPFTAEPDRWIWLGLSGVVGLVLGDAFLFQAFVWIGPRLTMLMMSMAPIIAAGLAWIFLGETLSPLQISGIMVAISGIAWVVMEKNSETRDKPENYYRGILFGLGAATGQAAGLVLAKNGLWGDFSPISGNLIRMLAAASVMWLVTAFQGQIPETLNRIKNDRRGLYLTIIGAITGPFIGVSLSLLALQNAKVGVASTLMALPPIILLPVGYFYFKEKFGWGAISGTIIALIGVSLLFWN